MIGITPTAVCGLASMSYPSLLVLVVEVDSPMLGVEVV